MPVRKLAEFKAVRAGKVEINDKAVPKVAIWQTSCRKLRAKIFRPGEGVIVETPEGPMFNIWRLPNHPAVEGAPEAFLEHLAWLLPHDREREYFFDWLAYKAQHPASRAPAVMMVADNTGVGRTTTGLCISNAFGPGVRKVTFQQLIGNSNQQAFDSWQDELLIGIVDEAADAVRSTGSKYLAKSHAYEVLKERIDTSPSVTQTNAKYGAMRYTTIYANYLILTNHVDALPLPENDRRITVLENPSQPRLPAYYEVMAPRLLDPLEGARLWYWLQARDVSGFDRSRPLITPARERMMDANSTDLDDAIDAAVEAMPGLVVSKRQWLARIAAELGAAGLSTQWESVAARIWRQLPYPTGERFTSRPLINGRQEYVRVKEKSS